MVTPDFPLAFATILSQKASPLAENARGARRAVRAAELRETRNAGRADATRALLAADSIETTERDAMCVTSALKRRRHARSEIDT